MVGGGGGGGGLGRLGAKSQGRVYESVLPVSCKFHTTENALKREVSQNVLSRIVGLAERPSPAATQARITFVYMYAAWHHCST